ncbi:MAG: PLP-dependent aminotransferase family protein [Oscillospiraceae bacterium]|nr:PLP-dependent aminotransferase family protein [Oscillospiraceae bacterium]
MNYHFADRVLTLQPSAIREILKFTSFPGIIPFAAGNPAPEAFPVAQIAEITANIFRERPVEALQYSVTEGYMPLRDRLKRHMAEKHGAFRRGDELIITSGAQQVMELTAKTLCNEGDVILCEAPSFIGSLNAFRSFNARLCGIPLQPDGMDLEALKTALQREKNVRFIYVIPNFQNPAGITTSLEKRREIYRLAKRFDVMILEDNPYGDIRFSGEDIPPIKSLDEDGIVVYAGSFSKILSPGMRVGWCVAPAEVCAKIIVCKQVSDVHSNILAQLIADEFMGKTDFQGHLTRIRDIYRRKATLAMKLIDRHLCPRVSYNPVEGGLFIWCKLSEGINMPDFCRKALENRIAVVPGNAFLVDESEPCDSFRINFSTPTEKQLIVGMEVLGK